MRGVFVIEEFSCQRQEASRREALADLTNMLELSLDGTDVTDISVVVRMKKLRVLVSTERE